MPKRLPQYIVMKCPHDGCGKSYEGMTSGEKMSHTQTCPMHPNKGERARKISMALKGITRSDETREKLRLANLGKPRNPESTRKQKETFQANRRAKGLITKPKKTLECKHCSMVFPSDMEGKYKTAHMNSCGSNPNLYERRRKIGEANTGRKMTDENRAKLSARMKGVPKTKEQRRKMSESCRRAWINGTHTANKKVPARIVVKYTSEAGDVIDMRSSWEVLCAARLDEQNVKWEYEAHKVSWTDYYGKVHAWIPDFYLPDYDLYIDPHWMRYNIKEWDKMKWDCIMSQHDNVCLLTSEKAVREFDIHTARPGRVV